MPKRKLLAALAVVALALGFAPSVTAQPGALPPDPRMDLHFNVKIAQSGKCLDVVGGFTDSGVQAVQWPCRVRGYNQMWRLNPVGGGFYQLVVLHSGKCLDVTGGSLADGARAQQWQCLNQQNQYWRFEMAGNGFYRIIAAHSRKCLSAIIGETGDGAGIYQFPCVMQAVPYQSWTLFST